MTKLLEPQIKNYQDLVLNPLPESFPQIYPIIYPCGETDLPCEDVFS